MCFSAALCGREEFLQIMKLKSTDLLTVKLWFDKKVSSYIFYLFCSLYSTLMLKSRLSCYKVNIPYASNVASAPDEARAWTFFDLNAIYDEYKESSSTVVQADFVRMDQFFFSFDSLQEWCLEPHIFTICGFASTVPMICCL